MIKVSIIIPVYNVESYLEECMKSVLNQSCKELEIICINDGSTDSSLEILKRFKQIDNRIEIVDISNGGLSNARNIGLTKAKGEYCYFLDSDDIIDISMCEILYEKARKDDLDLLYFAADSFYENMKLQEEKSSYKEYYFRKFPVNEAVIGTQLFTYLNKNNAFRASIPLQFFKKSFLEEFNLTFVKGIIHEDEVFSTEAIVRAKKAACIEDVFYHRRVREGSIMTTTVTEKNFNGQFIALAKTLALAIENKNNDKELQKELSKRVQNLYNASKKTYKELSAQQKKKILSDEKESFKLLYTLMDYPINTSSIVNNKIVTEKVSLSNNKDELNEVVIQLIKEKQILIQEINNIYNSQTFKLGSLFTFIPRKLRGGIRCYQENGWEHTIERIFCHIGLSNVYIKMKGVSVQKNTPINTQSTNKLLDIEGCVVSVIIPVYNAEDYLEKCIQSILDQTINNKNYEIICVDDGSKDNSLKMLREYEKKYSNIKVITQQNQYAGVARNNGMKIAKGEYLLFIDADDFMEKEMLEKMYLKAKEVKADIVVTAANIYNHETETFTEAPWYLNNRYLPRAEVFTMHDIPNHIFNFTSGAPWNKLFRRETVERSGLNFPVYRSTNDLGFVYPMLAIAESIVTIDTPLYHIRRGHENNLSSTKDLSGLIFYDAYDLLQKRLEDFGVYADVQKSFSNLMLTGCMYELANFKSDELRIKATKLYIDKYQYKYGVAGKPKEYFYSLMRYKEYEDLKQNYKKTIINEKKIAFTDIKFSNQKLTIRCSKFLNEVLEKQDDLEFIFNHEVWLNNDTIALALSTLCGKTYNKIYIDLIINKKTIANIEQFTNAEINVKGVDNNRVKSIDEQSKIILNFSGGFDSLAALCLMPEETKLVSLDFGGAFVAEAEFFKKFNTYTVTTNFRQLKYDRETWSFMGVGALLYNDYIGAKYNVFGTILEASVYNFRDNQNNIEIPPFSYAGLKDIKYTQGLTEVGTAMVISHYRPELINESLKSLSKVGSEKRYRKQLLITIVCEKYKRDIEIEYTEPPTTKIKFGTNFALDFLALYQIKNKGLEEANKTIIEIPNEAIEMVNLLRLDFYEKLNTSFLDTMPQKLRVDFLEKLEVAQITVYNDEDWKEFKIVREFLAQYHEGLKRILQKDN